MRLVTVPNICIKFAMNMQEKYCKSTVDLKKNSKMFTVYNNTVSIKIFY